MIAPLIADEGFNTVMEYLGAIPSPPTCTSPPTPGGSAQGDASQETYSVTAQAGLDYNLSFIFQHYPPQPPQSAGSLLYTDLVPLSLLGDTNRDESIAGPTGSPQISGWIRNSLGDPVPNATVGAIATLVSGDSNATFTRSTTRDANGMYKLTLVNGIYDLLVIPATAAP